MDHNNYYPYSNNIYTMITKEKEIENDRDRILRRFHFSPKPNDNAINNDNSITKSHQTIKSDHIHSHSLNHSNNNKTISNIVSPLLSPTPSPMHHNKINNKTPSKQTKPKRLITPIAVHKVNKTRNKGILNHQQQNKVNAKSLSISIYKHNALNSINTTTTNTVNLNRKGSKGNINTNTNTNTTTNTNSNSHTNVIKLNINTINKIATKQNLPKNISSNSPIHSETSEDTEKETKSHLILIAHKMTEDFNIIQTKDKDKKHNTHNTNDNDNDSLTELNHLNQKNINHGLNIGIGGNYLPISNDSSSHSQSNQQQTRVNHHCNDNNKNSHIHNSGNSRNTHTHSSQSNNTNFIQQYNNDHLRFINYSSSQAKTKKMKQLFSFNPIYNISNRLLNDEINNQRHMNNCSEDYRFIKEVKEDNDQLRKIQIVSFLKLSDYSVYNLLAFCYENYDDLVMKSHKLITSKINLAMNNIYERVIKQFKEKYGHIVQLEEYYFKQKTINKPRYKSNHNNHHYPLLDLILRVKILQSPSIVNKSYTLSYTHITKGIEYKDEWKFDIKEKSKPIITWLTSEVEIYNNTITRHCYKQPMAAFSIGDVIELHMNIFSKAAAGGINPFSITFEELIITECPKGFYQKSLLKCPFAYDPLYACEIENMIHIWKSSMALEYKGRIEDVKRYFIKHFDVKDIVYDCSKICFYKIKMKANVIGVVKRNHYVNFDIEIVESDMMIKNEIQVVGLLNIGVFMNKVQIRKGTMIILYMTDFLPN